MLPRDHVLAPQTVRVSFSLAPVLNVLESMQLLTQLDELSGLSQWLVETNARLSADELHKTHLVFNAFYPIIYKPTLVQFDDFESFVQNLRTQDSERLIASLWDELASKPLMHPEYWPQDKPVPSREQLVNDPAAYADFMNIVLGDCASEVLWSEAHQWLQDPSGVLTMIADHLQHLYIRYLKPEWERVLPMLQESLTAHQKLDYSDLTAYEAIRAVTGRDMTGKLGSKLEAIDHLIFVPTAHIGPYIGKYRLDDRVYIMFGARLPKGAQSPSSDLSRAELLTRLNALADDARLRILELLTRHDELCAQDIIEHLGLSQPTVSRHLSQLSATGYITERRRDVAKCYSLNSDRIMDTLRALTGFLSRQ